MKTDPGRNDLPPTTHPETEDAALWAVLDRARRPAPPSPYFTRRVLREVALLTEAQPAWQRWAQGLLGGRRVGIAAGATCAVLLAAAGVGLLPIHGVGRHRGPRPPVPAVDRTLPTETVDETLNERDARVIADLDEALDSEENRVWLDEDSTAS